MLKAHTRSLMREGKTRYSPLNGWEVAYFKSKFHEADLDGDGMMHLEELQHLLLALEEEPRSMETWGLLEEDTSRLDLISMHEFLVFLSIKRAEDLRLAKQGRPNTNENLLRRKKQAVEAAYRKLLETARALPLLEARREGIAPSTAARALAYDASGGSLDVLKLDIDGCECHVLQALLESDWARPKVVHVEVNHALPPPLVYKVDAPKVELPAANPSQNSARMPHYH